jgi:hypothetical protein
MMAKSPCRERKIATYRRIFEITTTYSVFPLDSLVEAAMFLTLHVVLQNGEERAMPTRKQACKFIRDLVAILFECRILAAELGFTAAALYGLYHAFRMLTQ